MNLSKNFTLEELIKTSVKADNSPAPTDKQALMELVEHVLQPVRDLLGMSITVTSGYRSQAVNKAVGGAPTSQHTKGEAADMVCDNNKKLFDIIRKNLVFDQLIWEYGDNNQPAWVHVSYKTQGNRKETLRAVKENGHSEK